MSNGEMERECRSKCGRGGKIIRKENMGRLD